MDAIREPPDALGTAATRRVICYAHRGARAYAPENTLLAFDLAFDLGADAIECDVQRSRDGELVVIHDATVNRTTGATGAVAQLSLDELRALDAGRSLRLPQHIPTLDETLALVRRRDAGINLEIKGESEAESIGTAEATEPVLRRLDDELRARVLVSCFHHAAVRVLKARLPWLRVAALYGTRAWRRRDMLAPARNMGAEAIHPSAGLVTPELVRLAHGAGLAVNVWTANRWGTIRRLVDWGVDGIFSDYPERVVVARATVGGAMPGEKTS